jgi:hypothetical protein
MPNRKRAIKPDDFKSVARRLECDEDKERFEKALSKIAHAKPKKDAKSKDAAKGSPKRG